MKSILAIIVVLALAACTQGLDGKLDGSSEKAFETSLARMKKSAKPDEVARLDDALLVLAITNVSIGFEGGILGAWKKISIAKSPDQLSEELMPIVNGMTGREIIKAGQKRKKEEAAKQLERVGNEIATLTTLRDQKGNNKSILAPIQILEPTLRFNSVGPQKMSVMDFKVRNGTDVAITYLYLRGTATESATGKILFSDDINYKLSAGPIAPGETKALRLPNSTHGKWNAPEIWGKDNLRFTIEVVNAESLYAQRLAPSFTFKDGERLATLEANKKELEKILAE